jgi:hypothetical protein
MKRNLTLSLTLLFFCATQVAQSQGIVAAKIQMYVGKKAIDIVKPLKNQLALADSSDVKIRIEAEPNDATEKIVKVDKNTKINKTDKNRKFEVKQIHVFLRRAGRPIYDRKYPSNVFNISSIDQDIKVKGFKQGDVLVIEILNVLGLKVEADEVINTKRVSLVY